MTPTGSQHDERCGANVAAYALGALDATEAQALARHLETCAVCHDELASFQQVVDGLAISAPPFKASRTLRRRTLRAIPDQRQLHRDGERRHRSRRSWSLSRPALALGTTVAAALVALAIVLGSTGSSPASRVINAQVTGQGRAQLRISGGHAELVLNHLVSPPAGQIYEVWLKRGTGAPVPAKALFGVDRRGDGNADVPGSLRGVHQVLVTVEPAGGTQVPTTRPVIRASLT